MGMRQYFEILRRRKWVVVVTTVVTLVVVSVTTLLMTPIYSSSATVRIAQIQDDSVGFYDLNYSERLINTYVELVRSRPFLEQTIQRLGLNADPTSLAERIAAESIQQTELLIITAESPDPATAMLIADTLGGLLVEEGEKLYSGKGKSARELLLDQLTALEESLKNDREQIQTLLAAESGDRQSGDIQDLNVKIFVQEQTYSRLLDAYENARLLDEARASTISIAEPAITPIVPTRPNIRLNLMLGAVVGLVGGIGLAFLFESLDTSIYSADDLEHEIDAPLIGTIPYLKVPARLSSTPFLLQPNGRSSAVEAFRLFRSNILAMDFGRPPKTLLVTSIEPDAGKTTILINLASTLGQSGLSVVVIDCDLRTPNIDKAFGVSTEVGLKDVVVRGAAFESAIRSTKVSGVKVLVSGPSTNNPAEILGLRSLHQLIQDLANWADLVLLDSPPLQLFSDAVALAPHVDSVALVVSRGGASNAQVQKALAQFAKVGAEQVGIVFNKAVTDRADY